MGKMTHGMTLPLIFNSLQRRYQTLITIIGEDSHRKESDRTAAAFLYKNIVTDNSKVSNIEVLRIC